MFPKKIRPVIVIIGDVISLGWCVFVVVTGWMLLGKVIRSGQVSPAMSIPMYFIYLAPAVGYILSSIRCIQTIILRVQNYKKGVEMND